ncbi:MAG: hypothetical protein ACE5HR_07415 [bacterium]
MVLIKKVEILPPQRHHASVYFGVGRLSGDYPGGKEEQSATSFRFIKVIFLRD